MSAIGPAFHPTPARGRRTLLSSCAVASALAVMGHAAPVRAASGYNASITGSVNYSGSTAANQATINLTNTSTVLTFTPTDRTTTTGGSINFQDALNANGGVNVTTFVGPRGGQDYTVLNRVIPANGTPSITFNGSTVSVLGDGVTRGGNIWFYSPGGIIVSPTARFDVGSLLLSTNAIAPETGYGVPDPNNIQFSGADGSLATIDVQSGATLSASGAGANYVALVAPRIIQSGTVQAAQTAYVAAEAGSLVQDVSINSGLFSIAVTAGTNASDALTHSGTTALQTGGAAQHAAFFVAVPKNTAITMLVGGQVNYASAASVVDGVVILSTGNVTNLRPAALNSGIGSTLGGGAANIVLGTAGRTSTFGSIVAAGRSAITTAGSLTITGDVNLAATGSVAFGADASTVAVNRLGGSTTLGGNLNLSSVAFDANGSATGGLASLYARNAGTLTTAGSVTVNANGVGNGATSGLRTSGQGGTASVTLTGSTATIGGSLSVTADGVGATGSGTGDGHGTGGTATVSTTNSALDIGTGGTGSLLASANGTGSEGARGGDGTGNIASITATGRRQGGAFSINVRNDTTVTATGAGGIGDSLVAGTGTGGRASIAIDGAANGTNPVQAGAITTGGTIRLGASGTGGNAGSGSSGNGGTGIGGSATASLPNGLLTGATLTIGAAGTGGNAITPFTATVPGAGGAGTGGVASLTSRIGGGVTIGDGGITLSTVATGGAGGNSFAESGYGQTAAGAGGAATGGRAVLDHGTSAVSTTGAVTVSAEAVGGNGGFWDRMNGGAGGNAAGGVETTTVGAGATAGPGGAYVTANGTGDLTASFFTVSANGTGGRGGGTSGAAANGAGGTGAGGSARITLAGNGTTLGRLVSTGTNSSSAVTARGLGGATGSGSSSGAVGVGGAGLGGGHDGLSGGASVSVAGGDLSVRDLLIDAGATGGDGSSVAGAGTGGVASLGYSAGATNSVQQLAGLAIRADGTGGEAPAEYNGPTIGGAGTGGTASLSVTGANLTLTNLNTVIVSADGTGGGDQGSGIFTGGAGRGGTASVSSLENGVLSLGTSQFKVSASGVGGDSRFATGGTATGGSALLLARGGRISITGVEGDTDVTANAIGGGSVGDSEAAHDGGAATGGTATVRIARSTITPASNANAAITTSSTAIDASAIGGAAGTESGYGSGSVITPANGGTGIGGGGNNATAGAYIDVQTGTASLGAVAVLAGGQGGSSAAGGATGTGIGGRAAVSAGVAGQSGGVLNVSVLTLDGTGTAGGNFTGYGSPGGAGGAGIGGSASLATAGSGRIVVTSETNVDAGGTGADGAAESGYGAIAAGAGGAGTGGTATVTIAGGSFETGGLSVSADASGGRGGSGNFGTSGVGGNATAGGATDSGGVALTSGTGASVVTSNAGTILLSGNLAVSARASAGDGGTGSNSEFGADGGTAIGGLAQIRASGGSTIGVASDVLRTITTSVDASASGGYGGGFQSFSGNFPAPVGGRGGSASGGTASIAVSDGANLSVGNIDVVATAAGGYGAPDLLGGNAIGGTASILADGGTIAAFDLADEEADAAVLLDASAQGGENGGAGTGGTASLIATNGGSFNNSASGANIIINVSGTGKDGVDGHFGAAGGAGGNGTAGSLTLDLGGGTLNGLTLLASAIGGNGGSAIEAGYGGAGGNGGSAGGGILTLTAREGATINLDAVTATRTGGSGGAGASGGNGADGARGADADQVGATGGAGGAGAAGQAGGTGGRGGDATGAQVNLVANVGTITLSQGEGPAQIDFGATAGDGGQGGDAGNGGIGGSGGAGGPAGTRGGVAIPAGPAGAAGGDGDGGRGGDSGTGGTARGGIFTINAAGGTFTAGDVDFNGDTQAGSALAGGAGGSGGVTTGAGDEGIAGDAYGGSLILHVGRAPANNGTSPAATITTGALSFSSQPNAGTVADGSGTSGSSYNGLFEIAGNATDLQSGATSLVRIDSLDVTMGGGVGGPQFVSANIDAAGFGIDVTNDATVNASDYAQLFATGGGEVRVGGRLALTAASLIDSTQDAATTGRILANQVFLAADQVQAQTPIVATRDGENAGTVRIIAGSSLLASDITATDSIALSAFTNGDHNSATATVGNLTTTAAVDPAATSLAEAGGGTINVTVGISNQTSLLPDLSLADANLDVTGTISASNTVQLTAGGDVHVLGGAQVLSNNLLRIDVGDNAIVDSGAFVRAALDPLADPAGGTGPQDLDTPAGLYITAGQQQTIGLVPGEVALIDIAGTVTAGRVDADGVLAATSADRRGILLSGQAVQTTDGTIGGRSLTVNVTDAPAPGTNSDTDFGSLTGGCVRGDACLGAVDLTDMLTVGGLSGTDVLPTHVRIASGTSTLRTVVRAQADIDLGQGEGASLFGGTDLLRIQSVAGAVNLLGTTTLAGGVNPGSSVQILGETGINGGGATITSGGTIGLYTGSGDLTIGSLRAQTLNGLNADSSVAVAGAFNTDHAITINDTVSLSASGVSLSGAAGVFVNQAEVNDGFDIRLTAQAGDATLNGTGTGLGTAEFITVNAGSSATLNNATAAQDINLSAGSLASADGITAGGSIFVSGNAVSLGSANTTGAFVENGYGGVSDIVVDALGETGAIDVSGTLNAYDRLFLRAPNGPVNAAAATLTAGDDVVVAAQALSVGTVISRGTSAENGYGVTADGSNITLTATGPDIATVPSIVIASANANNNLVVEAQGPAASIGATSLVAGANVDATAEGAVNVTGGSAGGDFSITSNDGGISAGTLLAGNDLILAAATGASLTSGDAGEDIMMSGAGSIALSGGTATRDISLTSTGADASGGTLSAGRDITIGAATTASLTDGTAGDDIAVSGNDLLIGSAKTTGAFAESGYGADGSNISLSAARGLVVTGTADAFDTLTLTSQTGVVTAETLTAGDDVIASGDRLSIRSVTSRGTSTESGYGATPDGSNIRLTATGASTPTAPAIFVDAANAARDLTLTASDAAGSIATNALTAGQDIIAMSGGANGATTATAGRDISFTSTNDEARLGSLTAGRDVTVTAATNASATFADAGQDVAITGNSSAGLSGGRAVRDITLSSSQGGASGTNLIAGRDLTIAAAGLASLDGGTAGDDIFVSGGTVTITSANTTGAFVESGYGADGSNITVNATGAIGITGTANAFDTLRVTSTGGAITANALTAGDDAIVSGGSLAITSVISRGTSTESGYGTTPDGSNIRLTATAPGTLTLPAILVTSANAAQDLTLSATAAAGTIGATSLIAGRDVTGTAGGAINVTSGNAGRDFALTSSGGAVGADTLSAGNDLRLSGSTNASLNTGTAGRDLTLAGGSGSAAGGTLTATRDLTETGGTTASLTGGTAGRDLRLTAGTAASAGTLRAGDDIFVNGATATIGTATSTGAFAESGYGADGSNITVATSGAITLTGAVNAFDTLRVTSTGGAITATGTGSLLTAGNDAIVSGARLAIDSVTSRGTSTEPGGPVDGSNIILTATGPSVGTLPAILVTSANASRDLTVNATNAAATVGTGTLIAGRDIAVTSGDALSATVTSAGRDATLASTGGSLGATRIVAGRNIAVTALRSVTLTDATANGPVVASTSQTDATPTSGLVTISAGRTGTTGSYGAADVTLNGTVSAAGHVLVTAGGDVVVGPAAQLRSDNRITLNAGDDILIRNGATVSAALNPLPATVGSLPGGGSTLLSPATLILNAGTLALGYTPAAGNVASLIVDGTISAAARPIAIVAGAIQADTSTLTAGTLTIDVGNAPAAGAAQSNDGGQLRLGCLQGDVCLGTVTLTGFTAGTLPIAGTLGIGQRNAPTNVRIAGPVDVASAAITARDSIYLGNAATTAAITQTAAGRFSLDAGRAVNLLGNLTIASGTAGGNSFGGRAVAITAGTDVTGATARIVSGGPLTIDAGGSVTLASTRSAESTQIVADAGDIHVGSLTSTAIENSGDGPGSGVFLTAGGDVSGVSGGIADIDATGDISIRAGGNVALGTATARNGTGASDIDGSDIDIRANGNVGIATGIASDDASVTAGGDINIGSLAANGETNNDVEGPDGGGLSLSATNITAGTLTASASIDAEATQLLRVDNASSPGTISFVAGGSDVPPGEGTPNGILAVQLGTVNAGAALDIGASNGGIGFASLTAPSIALNAGSVIAGGDATALTGDVTATAPGDVSFGTVDAAGSISANAGGAFRATALHASGTAQSSDESRVAVTAGTIDISGAAVADRGNVDLDAAQQLAVGSASAGDSVRLTSNASSVTAGDLAAGTLGVPADSGEGPDDTIRVFAGTGATIGNATAPLGDVLVVAREGDIQAGDITTGGNALLFATNNVSAGTVQAGQRFFVADTATYDAADSSDPAALDTTTLYALDGAATLSGPATADSVTVAAAQGIGFGAITSTGTTLLGAIEGPIAGTSITAGGDILLTSQSTIDLGAADAGGRFAADGYGAQTYGTITSAGDVLIRSFDLVTAATITAGDDIEIGAGSAAIALATTTGRGTDTLDNGDLPTFPNAAPTDVDPTPIDPEPPVTPIDPEPPVTPVDPEPPVTQPVLAMPATVGVLDGANIRLFTFGDARLTTGNSAGSITVSTETGRVDSTSLTAAGLIDARSRGSDIALGDAGAGTSITLFTDGGGIGANALTSGTYIDARARDDIAIANATAGTALDMTSLLGGITGTGFTAGTTSPTDGSGNLTLTAATDIGLGSATAFGDVTATTDGAVSLGTATAGGAFGSIVIDAGTDIALGNGQAAGAISLDGDGDLTSDMLVAAANIRANLGGDIAIGTVTSTGGNVDGMAGGAIDVGTLSASRSASLTAGGATTIGSATARDLLTISAASLTATTLATTAPDNGESGIAIATTDAIAVTGLDSAATADVRSTNGPVTLGSGTARGTFTITSGGATTADALTALAATGENASAGNLAVTSGGVTRIRQADAGGTIAVDSTGDIAQFASITAAGDIDATTRGALTAGTVTSTGGAIDLAAVNRLGADNVRATGGVDLTTTTGNIVVTSATAGAGTPAGGPDDGRSLHIRSGGDATIGDATAALDIGIAANGAITAGTLNAPSDIILLAGTDLNLGSATTLGQFYVANASVLPSIGDFDRTLLAAATPTPTGGAVTITGTVNAASLLVSAGDALSFNAIAATGTADLRSARGGITGATITAGGNIALAAAGAVRVTTDIRAGGGQAGAISVTGTDIALNALGDLNLTTVDATDGSVALTSSGGAITLDRATATQNVLLASGDGVNGTADSTRSVTANVIQAGLDATVNALGQIGLGTVTAGETLALSSASGITLGSGDAGFNATLFAAGPVNSGTITAGNNFSVGTTGAITLTDVTAGGLLSANSSGGALTANVLRAGDDINLSSIGNLAFASATSTNGDVSANTRGDLSFGSVTAGGSVILAATGALGIIDNGSITAGDSISATTGLDLTLRALSAVNNLTLNAGGALSIGDAAANLGALTLTAGQALTLTGTGTAGTSAVFTAGGPIDLATVTAGGALTARSTGGALRAGTLRAGDDLNLTATGDILLADGATTRGAIALNGAAINVTTASAATSFSATGTGAVTIAAPLLSAGRSITLTAGGALTANGLRAINSITATSGAVVTLGDVESVGGTVRSTAGGSMTVGNARAAGSIFLTAAAAITAGDLTAGTGPILPGEGATSGNGGTGSGGGTDVAPAGIAPGFDENAIVRCDDCFTSAVTLPFLVNYFGNTYDTTYVSNNGYLTFNTGQGTFTPTGLGAAYRGQPIVAPFFADVDTRNGASAQVTYGEGTFAGRQAFGATYANVGYFPSRADKTNSFQIVLANRADTGTGNFDIYYNYTNITWETGDASGGANGFGGTSAAVGFNAGTGGQPGTFFELPGSRIPGSFLNTGTAPLITGTNNGTPGQLVFMVRNGAIAVGGAAERPTVHVTNFGAGNTAADINLSNISAEAAEVHGSAAVNVGNVDVGDRASGIASTGQPYATVLDAATNLTTGNVMSTGLVALGARTGDLLAGTITTASSAAVLVGGSVQLGAVTTGSGAGDSLFVSAPGALVGTTPAAIDLGGLLGNAGFDPTSLAGATPTRIGGTLTIAGPVSTGNLIAAATGTTNIGAVTASNDIFIDNGAGLNLTTLSAGGDIEANSDGNIMFASADADGAITFAAGGTLSPVDTGTINAGTSISATTGGDLTVGTLAANQNLTLVSGGALSLGTGTAQTGALTLTAARTLTVSGAATAGGNATLTAGGAINTAAVTSGDTLAISSTGSSITATDLLAANGITARALGNLFVRDAVVNATNGNLQLAGGFPFATTANAPFLLTGNTTVTGTVSAGTVTIQGGGDVSIGGNARIRSDGTILIASGDDIAVDSGAVIGLGSITRTIPGTQLPDRVGGPSNLVTLSAGSLRNGAANLASNGPSGIVMNGTVDGLAIALNSAAIDIGSTGQVGSASTTAATFTNNGTGRTIVGGTGDTTTYALTNAALGRTRAQAIRVVAPADVTVQTLGLTGSAATNGNLSGTNAVFEIRSPGSVSVEGAATVASAANTDLFSIVAGNRITVLSPSGSIAMTGTGTALGGSIRLAAPRIVVASAATATALDGLASLDARDERLGINDGATSDAGYLQANAIAFQVSNGLYIQNSGVGRNSDARRGFTVGAGGVTITTTGTTPAEIAINGRQALADGTFVTGKNLIGRLTLSGTGQATMASFDPRSTVNGCLITGMSCRFDGTAPTQPIQDVINQIINGQDDITGAISSVVQQLNSPLIELIDFTPFRLAGIIDEPVTGAGNDDYYTTFIGDEDSISADVQIGEQVTGTGRDQTTDEQVTGTGKDQAATDEQVTGTGRDQIEKPDGKCNPANKAKDPDCKK